MLQLLLFIYLSVILTACLSGRLELRMADTETTVMVASRNDYNRAVLDHVFGPGDYLCRRFALLSSCPAHSHSIDLLQATSYSSSLDPPSPMLLKGPFSARTSTLI